MSVRLGPAPGKAERYVGTPHTRAPVRDLSRGAGVAPPAARRARRTGPENGPYYAQSISGLRTSEYDFLSKYTVPTSMLRNL